MSVKFEDFYCARPVPKLPKLVEIDGKIIQSYEHHEIKPLDVDSLSPEIATRILDIHERLQSK